MPHFHFVTWCLSFICLLLQLRFCDFDPKMSGFPADNMPSFFIKMCHITNFWHPLHSSVWPHHQLSAPAMAPHHKKISGHNGKGSILTHHVCPVCSKDFILLQGLACHLTSVPYCCQSWLSVSNGLPIDNINSHSFWPMQHPRNQWSYHCHSPSIIIPNYSYFQDPNCLHCW